MIGELVATVKICTPAGYPINIPIRTPRLRAVSMVNGIGYFEMETNANDYPRGLFDLDRRVEISLSANGRPSIIAFIGLMRLYKETSNVSEYSLDYRDEINYFYVGGADQGSARTVLTRSDAAAIRKSPINRREGFGPYNNTTDAAILNAYGDRLLRESAAKTTLERDLSELRPWTFGNDWNLGDTITVASETPDKIIIGGPCWHDILKRRVIAYKTGTAQAEKTGEADALMYAYFNENLVSAVDATRNLDSSIGLTVGKDYAVAPSVTHSATYGNLFNVLEEIAQKSREAGMQLRFGFTPVWNGTRYIPRFEARPYRWGKARSWVLGTGTHNETQEIVGVDINIDRNGATTVYAKGEDTV